MSLVRRWNAYWFPPVPVRRVAVFRILLAAYALHDIAITPDVIRYARVDRLFYDPTTLIRIFHLPRLSPDEATAMRIVLLVALAAALAGLATRLALVIAAPLYSWWYMTLYSYGTISHNKIPIAIALWALAFAPAGGAYSLDAWRRRMRARRRGGAAQAPAAAGTDDRDPLAGWALRVVGVFLVAAYLLAAYAKLRLTGPDWVISDRLEVAVSARDSWLARTLADQPALVQGLQFGTFLLESTAFVLLLSRGRVRDVWVASGILFHLGTYVLLEIDFTGWVLAYAAFFRLEVGVDRLGMLMRGLGARLRPPGRTKEAVP